MMRGKPIVALDWGWVRGLNDSDLILPNAFVYLIPEIVFWEAADASTTPGRDPLGLVRRLHRFISANATRVFIGRQPVDLARLEQEQSMPLEDNFVATQFPMPMRTMAGLTEAAFAERMQELRSTGSESAQRDKEWFERFRGWFGERARARLPEIARQLSGDEARCLEAVRTPCFAAEFAKNAAREYCPADPDCALSCFPDRFAIGRWSRLVLYFAVLDFRGINHRNDYEDCHYAFLASYAGRLAATDRGLLRAVEAVFPGVKVWERQPRRPRSGSS